MVFSFGQAAGGLLAYGITHIIDPLKLKEGEGLKPIMLEYVVIVCFIPLGLYLILGISMF